MVVHSSRFNIQDNNWFPKELWRITTFKMNQLLTLCAVSRVEEMSTFIIVEQN